MVKIFNVSITLEAYITNKKVLMKQWTNQLI